MKWCWDIWLLLAIAFEWAFCGCSHRSLDQLIPTFHEFEGSSDIALCTNIVEVVLQGHHITYVQYTNVSECATSA